MSVQTPIEGDFQVQGARFGILATRFNDFIVERLVAGALDTLSRHGVAEADIDLVRVPGAYELPLAARVMARRDRWQALIALGCVIRGATPHFEYVAGACARGLSAVSLELELPVAFGVLTTDTLEQAIERAGSKAGNKGVEAALGAIEMLSLLRGLRA